MTETESTTCEGCGLTYFYAPRFHECMSEDDRARRAGLLRGEGESWADECVRRVLEDKA